MNQSRQTVIQQVRLGEDWSNARDPRTVGGEALQRYKLERFLSAHRVPPINGDDVLKMVQSSKYGRGTTPQQFNRWVQQIQNRKAKGFYGG